MRGRKMKPNQKCEIPYLHIAVDTETTIHHEDNDGTKHHFLRFGYAVFWQRIKGKISRREGVRFVEPEEFWAFVARKVSSERQLWIWAHNQRFDAPILRVWDEVDAGRLTLKWKALEADMLLLRGHYLDCQVALADTYHWFPYPLKEIGRILGLPKLPMPKTWESIEQQWEYCQRDLDITERAVNTALELVERLNLGNMRLTAATQALQHFKHLPDTPLPFIPSQPLESAIARDAYVGGRVEVFHVGKSQGPIFELDVNGAYGHIMGSHALPWQHVDSSDCVDNAGLWQRYAPLDCAASVTLETESPYPVRLPEIGTCYCVGRFVTTLAGPELQDAVARGAVTKVHRLSVYNRKKLCKPFADYWWRIRGAALTEKNELLAKLAKGMPCALYGKFAQLAPRWQEQDEGTGGQRWGAIQWYDPHTLRWHPARVIAGMIEVDVSRGWQKRPNQSQLLSLQGLRALYRPETEHSFCAISAWITSHLRMLMNEYRQIAGENHVFYQCVDALHVDGQGLANLRQAGRVDPSCRGKLKVKETYDSVEWYGINFLRVNGRLKAAGLSGNHAEDLEGKITALKFENLNSMLMREPNGMVKLKETSWEPDYQYRHSVRGFDGWITPHRLPREETREEAGDFPQNQQDLSGHPFASGAFQRAKPSRKPRTNRG